MKYNSYCLKILLNDFVLFADRKKCDNVIINLRSVRKLFDAKLKSKHFKTNRVAKSSICRKNKVAGFFEKETKSYVNGANEKHC